MGFFKAFLNETSIKKNFDDVGSSLIKRFDTNESVDIINAIKKNSNYSKIKRIVDSMSSNDAEYSDVLMIELNDGTKFTIYGFEGVLRLGGETNDLSKRYEIKAVSVEQLIKELPQAKIK